MPESKTQILIVDDSATQLAMLQFLLEEQGYRVLTARNGQEALDKAHHYKPLLIISDIIMPVMDGYELCYLIKHDEELRHTPVMLLTTLSNTEDIILGLKAKADYYLTKPYDQNYLLSRVKTILEQSSHAPQEDDEGNLAVTVAGKSYTVCSDRQQMLNMLFSTYENAIEHNRELIRTQNELKTLNLQLQQQRAQLEEANARLEALATQDGLTGLKNHRAFQQTLDEEITRARRYGAPLSLLLLDVDHFKKFNDTYGHPAGDEVLKGVARRIEYVERETDTAARYGGEEFVVILPNTNQEGAMALAERLRQGIEAPLWDDCTLTASIGVSTLTEQMSRADLISQADQALYHSKRNGRNCVTHAADIETT